MFYLQFLENNSYSDSEINLWTKSPKKLDYTAQLLSVQKVITVQTFRSMLTVSSVLIRIRFRHWLTALSMMPWSKWRHSSI